MDYYKTPPLRELDGIPIFSDQDAYIENYLQISSDHVAAISDESENPWIASETWEEMECSTLKHIISSIDELSNQRRPHSQLKVLDVGVGLGRLLAKIQSNSDTRLALHGIDISMPYLKIAKTKGFNVAMSKIEDMPYVDQYFDLISCTDVLEHVMDLNFCVSKVTQH